MIDPATYNITFQRGAGGFGSRWGGGGRCGTSTSGIGQNGRQGAIIITYTVAVAPSSAGNMLMMF